LFPRNHAQGRRGGVTALAQLHVRPSVRSFVRRFPSTYMLERTGELAGLGRERGCGIPFRRRFFRGRRRRRRRHRVRACRRLRRRRRRSSFSCVRAETEKRGAPAPCAMRRRPRPLPRRTRALRRLSLSPSVLSLSVVFLACATTTASASAVHFSPVVFSSSALAAHPQASDP